LLVYLYMFVDNELIDVRILIIKMAVMINKFNNYDKDNKLRKNKINNNVKIGLIYLLNNRISNRQLRKPL
jgi:hypothetical protein